MFEGCIIIIGLNTTACVNLNSLKQIQIYKCIIKFTYTHVNIYTYVYIFMIFTDNLHIFALDETIIKIIVQDNCYFYMNRLKL